MRYGCVFSGISAATVAWKPLRWKPVFFAEIDKFPSAVLAHHYPNVPNYGDVTRYKEWPDATLDVLVGGSPCQSFSVAGLRKGLADPRGNLALTFLGIADRFRPEWLIWENVPGVLSQDDGRAFGSILGGMAELGYHVSYRVLDAQYVRVDGFGRAVPQRRRRVFAVGNLRDWRRAAAVLFEPESLSGNPAPCRQAWEGVAGTIKRSLERCRADEAECGGLVTAPVAPAIDASYGRLQGQDHHSLNLGHSNLIAFGGNNTTGPIDAATAVRAKGGTGHGDFESETFLAFDCKAADPYAPSDSSVSPTLRGMGHSDSHNNGGGQIAIAFHENQRGELTTNDTAGSLKNGGGKPGQGYPAIAIQERAICENPDAGPDGAGVRDDGSAFTLEARQTPQAVAFPSNMGGNIDTGDEVSPSLRLGGEGLQSMAVAFESRFARNGRGAPEEICQPLKAQSGETGKGDSAPLVAMSFKASHYTCGKDGSLTGTSGEPNEVFPPLSADADKGDQDPLALIGRGSGWMVRRLTPRECERLQGFPDDYTHIPWRGRAAPDGPRYKALGNSMAVNVMRWLGRRIEMVEAIGQFVDQQAAE